MSAHEWPYNDCPLLRSTNNGYLASSSESRRHNKGCMKVTSWLLLLLTLQASQLSCLPLTMNEGWLQSQAHHRLCPSTNGPTPRYSNT
jgi:hypothetical protein